jgi:hypothetical protein
MLSVVGCSSHESPTISNLPRCGHLNKVPVEEDLSELLSHLVQWVQSTCVLRSTEGIEVVWLEVGSLPAAILEHLSGQICVLDWDLLCPLGALANSVCDRLLCGDKLALEEVLELLRVRSSVVILHILQDLLCAVGDSVCDRYEVVALLLDPF